MEAEILVAYRLPEAPVEEAKVTTTKTFGIGGIMFEDENSLPVGSLCILDLVLGEKRLEVQAKVVYARRVSAERYQIGMGFDDLSEEEKDRLTGFFLQEYEKRPHEVL